MVAVPANTVSTVLEKKGYNVVTIAPHEAVATVVSETQTGFCAFFA
jgi:predicted CoA-binding protein